MGEQTSCIHLMAFFILGVQHLVSFVDSILGPLKYGIPTLSYFSPRFLSRSLMKQGRVRKPCLRPKS